MAALSPSTTRIYNNIEAGRRLQTSSRSLKNKVLQRIHVPLNFLGIPGEVPGGVKPRVWLATFTPANIEKVIDRIDTQTSDVGIDGGIPIAVNQSGKRISGLHSGDSRFVAMRPPHQEPVVARLRFGPAAKATPRTALPNALRLRATSLASTAGTRRLE